ncbi:hypothetical protein D3C84_920670 [compost metagenome]
MRRRGRNRELLPAGLVLPAQRSHRRILVLLPRRLPTRQRQRQKHVHRWPGRCRQRIQETPAQHGRRRRVHRQWPATRQDHEGPALRPENRGDHRFHWLQQTAQLLRVRRHCRA